MRPPPFSRTARVLVFVLLAGLEFVAAEGEVEEATAVVVLDSELSLATAPELFDALAKKKNPRWRTLYRPPLGYTFAERNIGAFWFGVHLSDLYLAVQARDAQRTNNLCRDLESFGKNLGVSEALKDGVIRLSGLAEKQNWNGARMEIESTSQRIVAALRAQNDKDLSTLVRAGEWVRNIQIAAAVVDAESFDDLAMAVGGAGLLDHLVEKLETMKAPAKGNEMVGSLLASMRELRERWNKAGEGKATIMDVEATRNATGEILKRFSSRS